MEWFGPYFSQLHPLLQQLHQQDSRLYGPVTLSFGKGLARVFGRILAQKIGLPLRAGCYPLLVKIFHSEASMEWVRCFGDHPPIVSTFASHGRYPDGVWIERMGPLEFSLGVDVRFGEWHWVPKTIKVFGVPLPLWMFPKSHAYKRVCGSDYEFSVCFSMPVLGMLLEYKGTLSVV